MSYRIPVLVAALLTACSALLSSSPACAAEGKAKCEDLQVVLEVRLVTVADTSFERLRPDLMPVLSNPPNQPQGTAAPPAWKGADVTARYVGAGFLTERQVFQLLKTLEGDRRTNVMQAPRLTLLDGQVGNLDLTETRVYLTNVETVRNGDQVFYQPKNEHIKTGFQMSARPVVSADRRFVRLDLNFSNTELASGNVPIIPVQLPIPQVAVQGRKANDPQVFQMFLQQPQFNTQRIAPKVCIPDGNTAVIWGLESTVESNECGSPVLSKIPYLNRCFSNGVCGRETVNLLVLVTPRILVNEEADPKVASAPPPSRYKAMPLPPASAPAGMIQAGWESPPLIVQQPQALRNHAKAPGRPANILAELLRAYDEACAAGRTDEAERLARAALIFDPTCFQRR